MEATTQFKLYLGEKIDLLSEAKEGRELYYALKRCADIFLALVLLVVLSPIMIIIAILIYIDSPGPIIFSQERVGVKLYKQGQKWYWKKVPFHLHKFRTMVVNADSQIHQDFIKALIENNKKMMDDLQGEPTESRKLVNDKRLLRSGKFLRKFSLDELPQFWNVLVGDMSLIGPRPAIPYEVALYSSWHMRRLEAQPGITGLQQVNARSTEFDTQVQLDIEYIENQSWWLDIIIALKTPFAILSGRGAY